MKAKKRVPLISIVLIISLLAAQTVCADNAVSFGAAVFESAGGGITADENYVNPDFADEGAGELLVLLKDDLTEEDVTECIDLIDTVTGTDTGTELIDDGSSVLKVELSENENAADTAELIMQDENVLLVQPNYMYELLDQDQPDDISGPGLMYESADDTVIPDDPNIDKQWQLDAVNAYGAWALAGSDHSVTVAVIDSGCNLVHEDLAANLNTDLAYQAVVAQDFTYTMSDGTVLVFDDMAAGPLTTAVGTNGDQTGHGTQVSGVISAVSNNATGVSGVSYNANVLPVNVINRCLNQRTGNYSYYSFTEHVIRAYEYIFNLIDNGVLTDLRVINLSLGGYGPSTNDLLLEEYIRQAREDYGIISVCAGGNKGNSSSYMENGRNKRICPGDCDYAVAVTSIDKTGYASEPRRTASSDFNEYKDIAAPGDSLYTTKYTGGYGTFSGTSAASPVVSGVFALLFAYDRELEADTAVRAVYSTARDITGDANNIFDRTAVCSEGWDMYTGHGLINAKAALLYIMAIEGEDDMVSAYDYKELFPKETLGSWLITESGVIDPEKITFTSSSPSIASVGSTGVITAKKPGLSVITASSITGEKTASVTVRVMFYDVPSDHNYFRNVNWASDNGIAAGYSGERSGYFGVGDSITRGQIVQILWRMYGKPEPLSGDQTFTDVPLTHNYYKAIQWASEQGIAAGYKNGKFKPSDNCTRGQLMTFLWRYARIHNDTQDYGSYTERVERFSDVPLEHNYYGQIEWAYENRITEGFGDGTFGVGKTCTRGQCATFLYRIVRKWPVMMGS